MDSFGLWYKVDNEEKTLQKTTFEMHINLWSKLKEETYLDIGIKILNYKEINELIFLCPFYLDQSNIFDLSEKIKTKENIDLILNNDADVETKENYVVIKDHEKKCKYLIFPLKQAVENVQVIEPIDEFSKIIFRFKDFREYIEGLKGNQSEDGCSCDLIDIENLYIRFRIKSKKMENILFDNLDPLDNFLQSDFSSTQVIDLKINNIRNISPRIRAIASSNKEKLVEFKCIHFLLMEPAESHIEYMSNQMTCRKLENQMWNDYLDLDPEEKLSILVYHSKDNYERTVCEQSQRDNCDDKDDKSDEKEFNNIQGIKEFNQLVKISYSKTNNKIILKYIFYVTVLGVLASLIANLIWNAIGL